MRKLFGTRSRDTSDLLISERTFGISFQNALLNRSTQLRGIHKFREIKSASLERGKSSLLAAEAATQRVVPGPRARRVLTTGAVASAGAGESLSTQILSCPSCTALCALHCTDFMTFLFVATLSLRDANTLLLLCVAFLHLVPPTPDSRLLKRNTTHRSTGPAIVNCLSF